MSSVNGRLTTCDLCGEQDFAKHVGDGETDGGFTRWNNFETIEGWANLYWGDYHYVDLCPECANTISKAIGNAVKSRNNLFKEVHDD